MTLQGFAERVKAEGLPAALLATAEKDLHEIKEPAGFGMAAIAARRRIHDVAKRLRAEGEFDGLP